MQILMDTCEKKQHVLWRIGRKIPIYKTYFLSKPDFDGSTSFLHLTLQNCFVYSSTADLFLLLLAVKRKEILGEWLRGDTFHTFIFILFISFYWQFN